MLFRNLVFLALVLCLSACSTFPPTSARLQLVRTQRSPALLQEVKAHNFAPNSPIFIRIFKEEAVLELWMKEQNANRYALYKTYPICAFSGALGPKQSEGDGQAPEGFYSFTADKLNPNSTQYLSFNIGYPNTFDRYYGRTGSLIMVHGGCKSEGCFAMSDPEIEEIYLLAENAFIGGQKSIPVHIFPFRMESETLQRRNDNKWIYFWVNLKQGYDLFEKYHIPPDVSLRNGRYAFTPKVFDYLGLQVQNSDEIYIRREHKPNAA